MGPFQCLTFPQWAWTPSFFISKLKFPYDKYSVDKVWTKIYCQFYFRGITLSMTVYVEIHCEERRRQLFSLLNSIWWTELSYQWSNYAEKDREMGGLPLRKCLCTMECSRVMSTWLCCLKEVVITDVTLKLLTSKFAMRLNNFNSLTNFLQKQQQQNKINF